MAHNIYNVLDEFNLTQPRNRLKRLLNLSPSNYSLLLDKIEQVYSTVNTGSTSDKPFELWLPYSTEDTLKYIPSHLFLFEKVYMADTLYDTCSMLAQDTQDTDQMQVFRSMFYQALGIAPNFLEQVKANVSARDTYSEIENRFKYAIAKKIDNIINFYVRYRELIEEGVFTPYINVNVGYEADPIVSFLPRLYKEFLGEFHSIEDFNQDKILQLFEMGFFFINSLEFKSLFPPDKCPNIDFGNERNKRVLDKMIQLGTGLLGDNIRLLREIQWPQPQDEIIIPSLSGIPPQELLAIRQKERASIEGFRYKTQKKLLEIRKTIGSDDYASLIKSLQVEQRGQIAEIELMAQRIRRDYLRKITYQIGVVTFSAAGAILSASVAAHDPLTLIGVGIGGAGLSVGISKLFENWISYQAEVDKLREEDSYILWRASHYKHHEQT